jgi:hypothetical protein
MGLIERPVECCRKPEFQISIPQAAPEKTLEDQSFTRYTLRWYLQISLSTWHKYDYSSIRVIFDAKISKVLYNNGLLYMILDIS